MLISKLIYGGEWQFLPTINGIDNWYWSLLWIRECDSDTQFNNGYLK